MTDEIIEPFDQYSRENVKNAPPLPVAPLKREPAYYPQQSQLSPETPQEYFERTGRLPPGYESSPLIPIVHGQSNDELAENLTNNAEKNAADNAKAQSQEKQQTRDEDVVEKSQQIPEQPSYEPQALEQSPAAMIMDPSKFIHSATTITPRTSILLPPARFPFRLRGVRLLQSQGWNVTGYLGKGIEENDMPGRFPPQFPVGPGYSMFDFQYATKNDALGRDPRDQNEYPYLLSDAQGNSMRGMVRHMNVGHQIGNRIIFPLGIIRGNRQKKDVGSAEEIQYVDEPPPVIMTELPKAPFQPPEPQIFRPIEIPVITAQIPSPQPTSRKITGFQTGNKLVFPMGLVRTTTEMTRLRRFPPEFGAIGRGIPFRIRKAKK